MPDPIARLEAITPLFIVRDVMPSIAFYRERLNFSLSYIGPDGDPFFAMVSRDGVQIMLKAITPEVLPIPNHTRHQWAHWDAFIYTADPDVLAAEFTARGVTLRAPLGNTEDNLRGFALQDADGYVLFFGRPA
jgi:catechol 2,3-dioxygenase-like lactoylglutathione lyase family enzyme